MNLNIQLTPEDYVRANYLNMRPRPAYKLAGYVLLALTILILGISFYRVVVSQAEMVVPLAIVGGLAYLAFFFGIRWPQRLKKIFRQQKSLHSPFAVEINDGMLFSKSEIGEVKLTWDHFIKWKENKYLITLYQSDIMLHIFPKRSFASPEELAQFRELLTKKVGPAFK